MGNNDRNSLCHSIQGQSSVKSSPRVFLTFPASVSRVCSRRLMSPLPVRIQQHGLFIKYYYFLCSGYGQLLVMDVPAQWRLP
jgi:hypothetical protein